MLSSALLVLRVQVFALHSLLTGLRSFTRTAFVHLWAFRRTLVCQRLQERNGGFLCLLSVGGIFWMAGTPANDNIGTLFEI